MTHRDPLPICPACEQDWLFPVSLPKISNDLELCLECDLIRDEAGEASALHSLMAKHNIKDYATPIICQSTGLDIKDPSWKQSFRQFLLESTE